MRLGVESYSKIIERVLPPRPQAGPSVVHLAFEDMRWAVDRWCGGYYDEFLKDLERVVIRDCTMKPYVHEQRGLVLEILTNAIQKAKDSTANFDWKEEKIKEGIQ
jgi:hypothetical protein